MAARNPGRKFSFRARLVPRIPHSHIFLALYLNTLSIDGLSRRGATFSLETSRYARFVVAVHLLSRASI